MLGDNDLSGAFAGEGDEVLRGAHFALPGRERLRSFSSGEELLRPLLLSSLTSILEMGTPFVMVEMWIFRIEIFSLSILVSFSTCSRLCRAGLELVCSLIIFLYTFSSFSALNVVYLNR